MAFLIGQDSINKYAEANPNAGITSFQGGNVAQKKAKKREFGGLGFIGNVVDSIADPFLSMGVDVAETADKIKRGNEGQKPEDYRSQFQSQDDYNDFNKNATLRRLQNVAGIGSWLLPGSGIAKATAQGALQGFSGARDAQTLQDALGQGVIGGVTGGATQGILSKIGAMGGNKIAGEVAENAGDDVAKVLKPGEFASTADEAKALAAAIEAEQAAPKNWAQRVGRNARYKDLGYTAEAGPQFATKFDSGVDATEAARKFYNLPRGHRGLDDLAPKVSGLIENVAETDKGVHDLTQLFDKNRLKTLALNNQMSKKDMSQLLRANLSKFTGEDYTSMLEPEIQKSLASMSGRDLLNLKRGASNAYYGLTSAGKEKPEGVLLKMLADITGEEVNQIPSMSALNSAGSAGAQNAEGVARAFNSGLGGVDIASPQSIPGKVANKVLSGGGQILEKAGDVYANGLSELAPNLPGLPNVSIPQPLAQSAAAIANSGAVPYLAGGAVKGAQDANGFETLQSETPRPQAQQDIGYKQTPAERLTQEGLKMGLSVDKIGSLLKSLGLDEKQGKQLSTKEATTVSDMKNSISSLGKLRELVKSNGGRFGGVQGGAIGDALGFLDPGRSGVSTTLKSIVQEIAKGLEGKSLTDRDFARYDQFLPKLSDTPEQAAAKIDALEELAKDKYQSHVNGLADAGYRV